MIRKLLNGTKNLESYVDNIFGHSKEWDYHLKILRDFFNRVRNANLVLKPSKCKIGFGEIEFLGHNLQGDSIGPQDKSVGQILKTERPQTKKRPSLLGMVNFYRRYIPNCAKIVAPIAKLTRNHCPNNVEWSEKRESSVKTKQM